MWTVEDVRNETAVVGFDWWNGMADGAWVRGGHTWIFFRVYGTARVGGG